MLGEKIYWYILYARTGSEVRLVERLKYELDVNNYLPFIPQKACVFRRQGQKSLFQKICFPGYVFIESNKPAKDFIAHVFPVVYTLKDAYKFLCYGDRGDIAMREEERIALSRMLGKDYCIDISTGLNEGDSIKVISGPLINQESTILRINKGRKEAVIAVEMFGAIVPISVGIEVIEKINN